MADEIIEFYLSGGNNNSDKNNSIGGYPGRKFLGNESLNGLFNKVSKEEGVDGGSVYRCLYIVNVYENDLIEVKVQSIQSVNLLSECTIGFDFTDENQRIVIFGSPTSGTFKLRYKTFVSGIEVYQETDTITFDPNLNQTALNIKNALNDLTYLDEINVSVVPSFGQARFDIFFTGVDGHRAQEILEALNFSVAGATGIDIIRILGGGPINQIAPYIQYENQAPNRVEFYENIVEVGSLKPGDLFPIWIKRTTPEDTTAGELDEDSLDIKIFYTPQGFLPT